MFVPEINLASDWGLFGSGDGYGQPSLNSGCAKTSPRSHGHCLAATDFWSMAFISALE